MQIQQNYLHTNTNKQHRRIGRRQGRSTELCSGQPHWVDTQCDIGWDKKSYTLMVSHPEAAGQARDFGSVGRSVGMINQLASIVMLLQRSMLRPSYLGHDSSHPVSKRAWESWRGLEHHLCEASLKYLGLFSLD